RCHRAFLVNIRMVVKVDGNSQGYKLNLEGCEEDVPVSRAYAKEVKALIENRTKS
ncbi:UNVERIFIED_CONTAM: LytTR family transcriptional regulator, partial [Bacteroidetes bacterium 56_B9]